MKFKPLELPHSALTQVPFQMVFSPNGKLYASGDRPRKRRFTDGC
jgi:hypothetical protein